MMLTFKGADKEMKCRGGFQYELDKVYMDDGAIRCGNKGFHSAAQGNRGHAAAQGDSGHAEVHGENSIAAAFGIDGRVMAEKIGSWLTAYEWVYTKQWDIKAGKCVRYDAEKIKPKVRYKLENGEFVEVEE